MEEEAVADRTLKRQAEDTRGDDKFGNMMVGTERERVGRAAGQTHGDGIVPKGQVDGLSRAAEGGDQ